MVSESPSLDTILTVSSAELATIGIILTLNGVLAVIGNLAPVASVGPTTIAASP